MHAHSTDAYPVAWELILGVPAGDGLPSNGIVVTLDDGLQNAMEINFQPEKGERGVSMMVRVAAGWSLQVSTLCCSCPTCTLDTAKLQLQHARHSIYTGCNQLIAAGGGGGAVGNANKPRTPKNLKLTHRPSGEWS